TTITTSTQTETTTTTAQQLTRLRRQRDLLLLVLGVLLALGAGLLVRLAPTWTNPAAVTLGAGALYTSVVVPYLLRRR
ncbi:hypothetical protein ACIA98_42775, partial [Streptomyces sp. NPDC051366]|uniref:hypothetical protein n=1 Tax=Streptomyces sp. NPDC051366 TaxID=3365652 RepID=UPI003796857B